MNGYILYEGPSQLDGSPIVVIATGFKSPSRNSKTGPLIQTYILHQNIPPIFARYTGADEAICGDCKFRNGTCYVDLTKGPTVVWKTYRRGKYSRAFINTVSTGRVIRIGAYGDPTAAPHSIWLNLLKHSAGHTGYTHQWKNNFDEFKDICMASVDTEDEYFEAKRKGWRTYRVISEQTVKFDSEVDCPAAAKNSFIQCIQCQKCDGLKSSSRDIVIKVHGAKNKLHKYGELAA